MMKNNDNIICIEISKLAFDTILGLAEFVDNEQEPAVFLASLLVRQDDKFLLKFNLEETGKLINCLLSGFLAFSYVLEEAIKLENTVKEQEEIINELIGKMKRREIALSEKGNQISGPSNNKNYN